MQFNSIHAIAAACSIDLWPRIGFNISLLETTEQLYLAAGKPQIRTKLNLLQLVFMGALIYPLTMRYGIAGAAFAALIPSTLSVFLSFREAGKIIDEDFLYIAKTFVPGIVGCFNFGTFPTVS